MAQTSIIPQKGVVTFRLSDMWTPEGLMRMTIWRALQNEDLKLFNLKGFAVIPGYVAVVPFPGSLVNIPLDRINTNPDVDFGIGSLFSEKVIFDINSGNEITDLNNVNGITDRIDIELDHRVLIRKPTESVKRERYFSEPTIDQFELEVYNTKYNDDILSCKLTRGGIVSDQKFSLLASVDGQGLFEKFIKPERYYPANCGSFNGVTATFVKGVSPLGIDVSGTLNLTPVYVMWEFKQWDETEYLHVKTGILQDAYKGTDNRWDRVGYKSPYLLEGKEFNPDRIYTFNCSHVVLIGLGSVKPRPTTDPNNRGQYYMPFYNPGNPNLPPNPISKLPYDLVGAYSDKKNTLLVQQGVANCLYTDFADQQRRSVWRRHISIRMWIKSVLDYTFGEDAYDFFCDDGDIDVKAGQLGQCELAQIASILQVNKPKKVNFGFDAPIEKRVLIPQALFGLYDEIDDSWLGLTGVVPIPTVHWGNCYESVFQPMQEIGYMFGLVLTVDINREVSPPRYVIRYSAISKHKENKFSTITPMGTPQVEIFPEGESGISVQNRQTFLNPATDDKAFQDLLAYRTSVDFPGTYWKDPEPNPAVIPATALKPNTGLVLSMCAGGDTCFTDTQHGGNTVDPAVMYWLSTGRPFANASLQAIADRSENFPMFSPLVYSDGHDVDEPTNPTWEAPDGNLDGVNEARCYAPVLLANPDFDKYKFATGPFGSMTSSFKMACALLYNKYFVAPVKKYTCNYQTVTQFTDITSGSKTYGKKHWKFLNIDYLNDIFQDEYWVHAFKRDWENMTVQTENWLDRHLSVSVGSPKVQRIDPPPPDPPIITPPTTTEPLCTESLITFAVEYTGNVCDVSATIDGVNALAGFNQQGDLLVSVDVSVNPCLLAVGNHIVCVTVTPCDTRVVPVIRCWSFTVNHSCCGGNGGGGIIPPLSPVSSTSYQMLGMGSLQTVTIQGSGKLILMLSGKIKNSSTGGAQAILRYGTGAPPAPLSSSTGTDAGNIIVLTAGKGDMDFASVAFIPSLVLGTTYWIDIALKAVTSDIASLENLSLVINDL